MNSKKEPQDLSHMDGFNLTVAVIFDYYLSQFPMKQEIPFSFLEKKISSITEECTKTYEEDGRKFREGVTYIKGSNIAPRPYVAEVVDWLKLEGFLHSISVGPRTEYQLTSKALAVLNAEPSGLDQPLRMKLTSAVKDAGSTAGKALISSVVGHIIGAAARSFVGAPPPINL